MEWNRIALLTIYSNSTFVKIISLLTGSHACSWEQYGEDEIYGCQMRDSACVRESSRDSSRVQLLTGTDFFYCWTNDERGEEPNPLLANVHCAACFAIEGVWWVLGTGQPKDVRWQAFIVNNRPAQRLLQLEKRINPRVLDEPFAAYTKFTAAGVEVIAQLLTILQPSGWW